VEASCALAIAGTRPSAMASVAARRSFFIWTNSPEVGPMCLIPLLFRVARPLLPRTG
jgi:hypothetical protein